MVHKNSEKTLQWKEFLQEKNVLQQNGHLLTLCQIITIKTKTIFEYFFFLYT